MSNLITLSYGDHPETLEATLRILMEAGAILEIDTIQIGAEMKKLGFDKGFDEDDLRKIRCSRVLLKNVNSEVETQVLCEALGIETIPEIYGDGEHAARGFVSDGCAIFEPAAPSVLSLINAAIIACKHLGQIDAAKRIEQALVGVSAVLAPDEFADAVIGKLY